jgi:hypothetical protein
MKRLTFKIAIVTLAMVLPRLGLTQQLTQDRYQTIWGATSNGICAGISIEPSDWPSHKGDFICSMELGNMTTNHLSAWFPSFEQRYEIELCGPDGQRIRQLKPFLQALHTKWSGLKPLSTNSTSRSLDWCFIKDTFDIRTNGQFTLIASMRVNVFTNFIVGQMQMQSEPSYFLLPPVTNTFNIPPENLPPNNQTNSPAK